MPAFNFPCEIFKEIMLYTYPYIPEKEDRGDPQLDLQVVSPPITASHVCRSWRRTLLSDSTMWTCLSISEMKSDGIMELLRRSGSSLLNVFINLNPGDLVGIKAYANTNVLSILFQEMHRFKVLYLQIHYGTYPVHIAPPRWTRQILSSLQRPAPQLQTFCFRNGDVPVNETFLDTLFSGDAPNLKSVHYLPPNDFLEVNCPLFHNLSELCLTLPRPPTMDVGRFLDLLEVSPRLKLLFVGFGWEGPSIVGSWRVVDLPCLQRLVLSTHPTIEIVELILEFVKVPSTFKWAISANCLLELTEPPILLRLASQAHFTSLDITLSHWGSIYLGFEEEGTSSHYINQFDHNRLTYSYDEISDLLKFWEPLVDPIVTSTITRLELVVQCTCLFEEGNTMLSTIFETIGNLEFLTIIQVPESIDDLQPVVVCLSALVPNPEQVEAFECGPSTDNPAPDPDLDSISTDSDQPTLTSEGTGTSSDRSISAAFFPCPRLRKLTVAIDGQLDITCAVMLRMCYTRRQEEGHPLEIFIHCPGMKEMVASILQLETSDIHVSPDPLD